MKRISMLAAFAMLGVTACATPDSVKLQGSKIDDLQRKVDKLTVDVDKLSDKVQGALEKSQRANEKLDSTMQMLQGR